ncbi:hypothetical protein [Sutcliffiella horikoshii]|uniref:hypothetical protein n=1 Tax=Sutcliffiella horikoshii TaxID=79883 RepID=UPI001F1F7BDC|nr:hypothetical protein [Sutcliffiella horikoshii]
MLKEWNEQSAKNNNIQPDLKLGTEQLADKKVQLDVQEQIGMEAIGHEEKDIPPGNVNQ